MAEVAIACVVFALSATWAVRYWTAWTGQGGKPVFYQSTFEPAVMIACGRGFVTGEPQPAALADFLAERRDAISCADIPPDLTFGQQHLFQRPWFYLMWFVGLAWRVLGISWSGMAPAFGALFGASAVLIYGIARLAMGRVLALGVVLGVSTSALHLGFLPHLRDFAKEPFTLALFLIIGLLVTGRFRPRRVVALAAAYGAVLAVAYGFRTDFLIDIPLLLITLALFLDGGPLSHIKTKLVAGAAFAAAFVAVGWPVLSSVYTDGGCQWHTVILGAQSPFDGALGIEPAPYDAGYLYADGYAYAQVVNFAMRTLPPHPPIRFCTPEYDTQSGRYFRTLVTTFPADFMIRAYASARTLAEAPFLAVAPPMPNWMSSLFAMRGSWLTALRGAGIWLVGIATLVAAAGSLRLGFFMLVFALYVGGYPALQFAPRHFFHLEFAAWWAGGFVAQQAIAAVWNVWRSRSIDVAAVRAGAIRMAMMAGCAIVLIALPLLTLRAYQAVRVTSLLSSYIAAPKTALSTSTAAPGEAVLLASRALGPFEGDLIEVDVNRERCGDQADITFKYDPAYPSSDYSSAVSIPRASGSAGVTRVFSGVYEHFSGVQFSESMADCVAGASRVTDPRALGLFVNATLPPDWERLPLHQMLARWTPLWFK